MRRATGSLFGLAYGDALGRPTEFMDHAAIVDRYGPAGPRELTGDPALVTDDTQLALAVASALLTASLFPSALSPATAEPALRAAFVAWAGHPDNNRAPGMTCLRACAGLAEGRRWQEATVRDSKGCGANMRVTPVGLLPGVGEETRAGLAQLQAALTHGHPTGLAASDLTAFAVRWLCDGLAPRDLVAALRQRCADQRTVYHERWLGDLWRRPGVTSPAAFIATGWDECAAALDRLAAAPATAGDPCPLTGAGWIAEEALATALYCYLATPDDPVTAIARGAASSGDSDSIACLAGAFAGAALGAAAWPAPWRDRIEYAHHLATIGAAWD